MAEWAPSTGSVLSAAGADQGSRPRAVVEGVKGGARPLGPSPGGARLLRRLAWVLGAICVGLLVVFGPPAASAATPVSALTSGVDHVCALTSTGGLECWGWNYYGQLGVGTDIGPDVCGHGSENYPIGCALSPTAVIGLGGNVGSVVAGYASTYALTSAGGVLSWGYNGAGELGDGTTRGPEGCGQFPIGCSTVPVHVSGLEGGVSAIGAGYDHACASLTSGGVDCWGTDSDGELGDGTTTTSSTPVAVRLPSGVTVTAIASGGGYHTCALTSEGGILCWGYNDWGELGDGTDAGPQTCGAAEEPCSTLPVSVQLPVGVTATAVTTGAEFSCALTGGGGVLCWGRNEEGELGDGTTSADSSTPVAVHLPMGVTVTAMSSMEDQTCALTSTGEVVCWGDGSAAPETVAGLEGVATAVAAGGEHACASIATGGVECWGFSRNGALGDGNEINATPAPVVGLMSSLSVSTNGAGAGTVSSNPVGIECGSAGHTSCAGLFAPGSTVVLQASPVAGSGFVGFTGGGCGSGSTCHVRISEAESVSATFALAPSASISSPADGRTYTVGESVPTSFSCAEGKSGPGLVSCNDSSGARTVSGGAGHLDTSTPGNHTYTVTATSGDGQSAKVSISYTIASAPGTPAPSTRSHTLTVRLAGSGAGSVIDGSGTISCPSACSHSYDDGAQETLSATPVQGSTFAGWSGGGCSGTRSCRLTIGADETVTADFEKEEGASAPARLHILGARASTRASRPILVVRGTIARAARGSVGIRIRSSTGGRRETAATPAPIVDGHWLARFAVPWARPRSGARTIVVTAHFAGTSRVRAGHSRRLLKLP